MGLLDKAQNLFGPLDSEIRARIIRFLNDPTEPNWDDIYSIIITDRFDVRTIWQAVTAIDPKFPRSKRKGPWPKVPDALTVARAIKAATENQ